MVLDKTGTLTEGNMSVVKSIFFPQALLAAGISHRGGQGGEKEVGQGWAEVAVWEMVSCVEQASSSHHPIATAIIAHATSVLQRIGRAGSRPPPNLNVQTEAGCGVSAVLPRQGEGGDVVGEVQVSVGKLSWLAKRGVDVSEVEGRNMLEMEGLTCVAAAVNGRLVGFFGLTDPVKKSAPSLIAGLRARKLKVVLVSGDNRSACQAVAAQVFFAQTHKRCCCVSRLAPPSSLLPPPYLNT